jgi:AraC-like DNA-binding protein
MSSQPSVSAASLDLTLSKTWDALRPDISSLQLRAKLQLSGATRSAILDIRRIRFEDALSLPIAAFVQPCAFLACLEVGSSHSLIYEMLGQDIEDASRVSPCCVVVVDPASTGKFTFASRFDLLQYSVSLQSLNHFSDHEDLPRVQGFRSGIARDVPLYHLSRAVLPAFTRGVAPSQTFCDWFVLSFLSRIVARYGQSVPTTRVRSGGLSPRNQRRIKEILCSFPARYVGVDELASACDLSVGHFAQTFRQTFGVPVHAYLLGIRIELAKDLLRHSEYSLERIGQTTGFRDQRAFTEGFSRTVGISPGRYRRREKLGSLI